MSEASFESLGENAWHLPLILSAPHGGMAFPAGFIEESVLDRAALLSTADLGTDDLIRRQERAARLIAKTPRSVVDLNRAPHQLDAKLISGLLPSRDPQVSAGYGVLPRLVSDQRAIREGKLSQDQAQARLDQHYWPYHERLAAMLDRGVAKFGRIVLLDIHSAPAHLMDGFDVIIGTCFGKTSRALMVDWVEAALNEQGLSTRRDIPFAGGYITEHYGTRAHVDAIQLEISRAWFADESGAQSPARFAQIAARFDGFLAALITSLGAGFAQSAQ